MSGCDDNDMKDKLEEDGSMHGMGGETKLKGKKEDLGGAWLGGMDVLERLERRHPSTTRLKYLSIIKVHVPTVMFLETRADGHFGHL